MKKVLLIDDKMENREAGKVQLSNVCDLMVVSTFKGAVEMMENINFDAVLTDVMLPGESEGVGRGIGDDTPYGLTIALMALSRNIPVRLVSDLSHHSSPIAWSLDQLKGLEGSINCIESSVPKNWRKAFDQFDFDLVEKKAINESVYKNVIAFFGSREFFDINMKNSSMNWVFIDEKENYISELLDLKPKYIWMTGELGANAGVCHEDEFRKAKSILDESQKIIFSGFLSIQMIQEKFSIREFEDSYVRLPIGHDDLLRKFGIN